MVLKRPEMNGRQNDVRSKMPEHFKGLRNTLE